MKRGREFKSLLLHHPVHQFLYFSENRSKFARVRAICDCAWTRRAAPGGADRGTRQNLSGLDSAGSTECSLALRIYIVLSAARCPFPALGALSNKAAMLRLSNAIAGLGTQLRHQAHYRSALRMSPTARLVLVHREATSHT